MEEGELEQLQSKRDAMRVRVEATETIFIKLKTRYSSLKTMHATCVDDVEWERVKRDMEERAMRAIRSEVSRQCRAWREKNETLAKHNTDLQIRFQCLADLIV